MDIQLTEAGGANDAGYIRPRVRNAALLEQAGNMLAEAWGSSHLGPRARLQEAMASSDFRNAAFEVLDRETLEQYQAMPAVWSGYARRVLVRDFKPKKLNDFAADLDALPEVPELTPYPERGVTRSQYELSVTKRGARFAFSWESWVNDELDELQRLPEALATAARESESREAASLLTDGNGPNGAIFNATAINGTTSNLMSGNPALTTASLTTAITTVMSRRDPQNRPIVLPRLVLVVPPALEIQARAIVGATIIRTTEGSREIEGPNWLRGVVDVVVDPWLPVLDGAATVNTTWYVVPAPSSGRAALAVGFLRGHEEPQVRVKADQGNALGGGAVGQTDGSFDIDDIQYRVRHVLGSSAVDPIGTLVSTGAGS